MCCRTHFWTGCPWRGASVLLGGASPFFPGGPSPRSPSPLSLFPPLLPFFLLLLLLLSFTETEIQNAIDIFEINFVKIENSEAEILQAREEDVVDSAAA